MSIKYVPGSDVKLADALSRVNPCNTGPIRGLDLSVHELHMHLNASPTRIVEIRMETSKYSTLHALCEIIYNRLAREQGTLPDAFDALLEFSRRTEC